MVEEPTLPGLFLSLDAYLSPLPSPPFDLLATNPTAATISPNFPESLHPSVK